MRAEEDKQAAHVQTKYYGTLIDECTHSTPHTLGQVQAPHLCPNPTQMHTPFFPNW
jgi:hypothetical protein